MKRNILKLIVALFAIANAEYETEKKLDWWQTSVIYQIYPRSFKDHDADGIGDLKGIEEKAEYLKDLGIGAVWLSPIFKSPMADMGYDIADFKAVDKLFGNEDDFVSLQKKLRKLDIKLILDFVPNHSSDEHEWFQKSVQKIHPYTDYYVWRDPKSWNGAIPLPPNNWVSLFQGSAWTYHPIRKQFYLHQFAVKQPDLNYRSKQLLQEMKEILAFWLDKEVDGFRLDAVPFLIEHVEFVDEPVFCNERINGEIIYDCLDHRYTAFQPESYQILRELRQLLEDYEKRDNRTRLMMTEAYGSIDRVMKFYGNLTHPIAHFPFNFLLFDLSNTSNAIDWQRTIQKWFDNMPSGKWPNWVLGNHDQPRIPTRFDSNSIDGLNMMLLLLPGTPITFNGDEIGMEDTEIRWEQTTDIWGLNLGPELYKTKSRDPERTPFQWDSSIHAGFSQTKGKTWLPVNPNYYKLNVVNQKNDPKSHHSIYKELIKLRSNDVFRYGDYKTYSVTNWILVLKRSLLNETYLVIFNVNNEEERVFLKKSIITENANTSQYYKVIVASANSRYNTGDELDVFSHEILMRPKSALVLKNSHHHRKEL